MRAGDPKGLPGYLGTCDWSPQETVPRKSRRRCQDRPQFLAECRDAFASGKSTYRIPGADAERTPVLGHEGMALHTRWC